MSRCCLAFVRDSLFPVRCFGCRAYGEWLCPPCTRLLPLVTPSSVVFEKKDRPERHLNGLIAATSFSAPVVARLIHAYKYSSVADLAQPLGTLLSQALLRTALPLPQVLTAVPLHPRRLRRRGFNQAELLAQALVAELSAPAPVLVYQPLLRRTRATKPQIKTRSRAERLANLRGAFALAPGLDTATLKGQTVWLVDDVATTLATLEECAAVLKAAGAREVYGLVVAK